MKKLIALLLAGIALSAHALPDFAADVGDASVKVAPERGVMSAVKWTNNIAVAQGQLVQVGRSMYMAQTGLVASAVSPQLDANFRALQNNNQRSVLVICNTGTETVWLNVGSPARLNMGMKLPAEWAISFSDIQAAVFAIAEGDGSTVSGVDVSK